jgi:hypothetical protein
MTHGVVSRGLRVMGVGVLTSTLVVGAPLMAVATVQPSDARTTAAAKVGNTYGGMTSQGHPVVVDLTSDRRKLVRALLAIEMPCTSGGTAFLTDEYNALRVSKKGKFGTAFGPVTVRNDDGTTTDVQGRISGKLNASRTKITGTWQLSGTDRDAAGAVLDTCDSGSVSWRAKQ